MNGDSLGTIILRRVEGDERFSIKEATIWAHWDGDGLFLCFDAEAADERVSSYVGSPRPEHRPWASAQVPVREYDSSLLSGKRFRLPKGYDGATGSRLGSVYYNDIHDLDESEIAIGDRIDGKVHVQWTCTKAEIGLFGEEKPPTRIEIDGWFQFDEPQRWFAAAVHPIAMSPSRQSWALFPEASIAVTAVKGDKRGSFDYLLGVMGYMEIEPRRMCGTWSEAMTAIASKAAPSGCIPLLAYFHRGWTILWDRGFLAYDVADEDEEPRAIHAANVLDSRIAVLQTSQDATSTLTVFQDNHCRWIRVGEKTLRTRGRPLPEERALDAGTLHAGYVETVLQHLQLDLLKPRQETCEYALLTLRCPCQPQPMTERVRRTGATPWWRFW